jgi:2Fe-2S ferredoxin
MTRATRPMGKITYVQHDGTEHPLELQDGTTLMEGAVTNGVPGIDGDCGGFCACGTCHVHVDAAWRELVGPPQSEEEVEMLQLTSEAAPDSRLACQIRMRKELNGLVVRLPEGQH